MIRIGDFSKLSHVSVKTLRFYDEMGLLEPIEVDRFNGYRYYEYAQLAVLNRILALKDLGFSLEDIRTLLADGLSAEQMRGMLKLREAESRQKVREETERLARIEARLRQIEQEDAMSKYDIVVKKIAPLKVASLRGVVPKPPDQGRLWGELEGYLAMHRVRSVGACLSLYHDDEYKETDWDIEVCEPIDVDLPANRRIQVQELPEVESMACLVYKGPFVTIGEAYEAILQWIDAYGYRICGPGREVYLKAAKNGSQTDPQTVTEIQYPVTNE